MEEHAENDLRAEELPESSTSLEPGEIETKKFRDNQVIIALVGATGSGKSNFIRKATGLETVRVGDLHESCR